MAVNLPNDVRKSIKRLVFEKADEFGYGSRSRVENSMFISTLTEDPEIGGVLRLYMRENRVRTYIKDGVLNAYAKAEVRKKLNRISLEKVIKQVYHVEAHEVGKVNQTCIYRSASNDVYLIHTGTYLKWETALRKLLECVAATDGISEQANNVHLCLLLSVGTGEMTLPDQEHLEKALEYVGVKVYFAR